MRPWTIALVAAAMLLSLNTAPARASEASTIIERCTHGQPLSGFSENGYRQALKQMPTEVSEYSDCPNLIRKAELAASGGGGAGAGELGAAGSNVALPLTPSEQREVLRAHRHGSTPVLVGNTPVRPGVVHADIASTASALPPSLLTVLGLLLAGALLFAIGETFKRVRARRHR
jgi:hypothetical protein